MGFFLFFTSGQNRHQWALGDFVGRLELNMGGRSTDAEDGPPCMLARAPLTPNEGGGRPAMVTVMAEHKPMDESSARRADTITW